MITLTVESLVKPTEDPGKVKRAMLNLFPDLTIDETPDGLAGRGADLTKFADLLRNQKIRDAARGIMLGAIRGNRMVLHLSKQAAYVGKVSFSSDSPLGPLKIELEGDDLEVLVDSIAPRSSVPG